MLHLARIRTQEVHDAGRWLTSKAQANQQRMQRVQQQLTRKKPACGVGVCRVPKTRREKAVNAISVRWNTSGRPARDAGPALARKTAVAPVAAAGLYLEHARYYTAYHGSIS